MGKRTQRSGQLIASNDTWIEILINDSTYEIRPDGSVWRKALVGPKDNKIRIWKRVGYQHNFGIGDGIYWEMKYKTKSLLIHRVIYRKFNGPLAEDLVTNHIDGDTLNNLPSNLELVTQTENQLHRFKSSKKTA